MARAGAAAHGGGLAAAVKDAHMATGKTRLSAEAERVNPVLPVHLWRSPAAAENEVVIATKLDVYSEICEHGERSLPNETGGFLLGRVAHDARQGTWLVQIDEAVPVQPLAQNPVHFSFTWRDVDRVRERREAQGAALVGWYHTHPGLGIFLSDTDIEKTHRVLFSELFQVALVYDPIRRRAGYFFWDRSQVIDASQAAWREFELAVLDDAPEPVTGAGAPVEIIVAPGLEEGSGQAFADQMTGKATSGGASALLTSFQTASQAGASSVPAGAARPAPAPPAGPAPAAAAAAPAPTGTVSTPVTVERSAAGASARVEAAAAEAAPRDAPGVERALDKTAVMARVAEATRASSEASAVRRLSESRIVPPPSVVPTTPRQDYAAGVPRPRRGVAVAGIGVGIGAAIVALILYVFLAS